MAATIAEEFDPADLASSGPPLYIRKVPRRRHWRGDDGMSADDRVKNAVSRVFPSDEGRVSVFRVENAIDLCRVVIGLNSGRGSLAEQLELLGITSSDLESAGVSVEQTPGDTACIHANAHHYDLIHDDAAIERLVRLLVENGRQDHRYKRHQMKLAAETALAIGCRATESELPSCECESHGPS